MSEILVLVFTPVAPSIEQIRIALHEHGIECELDSYGWLVHSSEDGSLVSVFADTGETELDDWPVLLVPDEFEIVFVDFRNLAAAGMVLMAIAAKFEFIAECGSSPSGIPPLEVSSEIVRRISDGSPWCWWS